MGLLLHFDNGVSPLGVAIALPLFSVGLVSLLLSASARHRFSNKPETPRPVACLRGLDCGV